MLSAAMTVVTFLLGGILISRIVHTSWQLGAIATLPVCWISLCAFFGCLETLTSIPARGSLLTCELVLLISTLIIISRTGGIQLRCPKFRIQPLSVIAMVVSLALFSVTAALAMKLEPWGNWDSLFTWVLRARFFFQGEQQWSNTFSNDLALLHPDYPPLLGWALFALWRLDGIQSASAIDWLCFPFWPSFVLLVFAWQRQSGNVERWRLTIPVAILLATPIVWRLAAGRLSDFILADVILATAMWWELGQRCQHPLPLALSGFLAGCAGLIKNEGLLWIVACMAAILLTQILFQQNTLKSFRNLILTFGAGLCIPVLCIFAFKCLAAPPSDLTSPQRVFEIGEIVQPGTIINPSSLLIRVDQAVHPLWHLLIWVQTREMWMTPADWGLTLWMIPVLLLLRRQTGIWQSPMLWGTVLHAAGYYFVYLITPYHPYWHLTTSLSRISAHLVPTFVCLLAFAPNLKPARSSSPSSPRWSRLREAIACILLILISSLNARALKTGQWKMGQQPSIQLQEAATIEFPAVPQASYVSDDLGIRDLYATQFNFVPTVLLVDRREDILLARFHSAERLRQYCAQNGWTLQQHVGGFGWAKNAGGEGLLQPVQVAPLQ